MTKISLAVGVALAAGLAGAGAARAEADDSLARDIAKSMVDVVGEHEKALSQIRAFISDSSTECSKASKNVGNDLDLRFRHIKAFNARAKELKGRADAETIAEAERVAKSDGEAKVQKLNAKMPETLKTLKAFQVRCPSEAAGIKSSMDELDQLDPLAKP